LDDRFTPTPAARRFSFQFSAFSSRTLSPRAEQEEEIGGVRVAVAVDIAVRRAPRAEEVQKIGGVDVAVEIQILGALLGRRQQEGAADSMNRSYEPLLPAPTTRRDQPSADDAQC
jgi:hypothetical protein